MGGVILKSAKSAKKRNRYSRLNQSSSHNVRGKRARKLDHPRWLRVNVRAPKVLVTAPAPELTVTPSTPSVQVEAPTVNIQAPTPLIIPAPIVNVEVEAEESAEEAGVKGLRKELVKCMKQQQTIELLLSADFGVHSRRYRLGKLIRVDEGIVELKTLSALDHNGSSVLIPLHRIVAIIPNLQDQASSADP